MPRLFRPAILGLAAIGLVASAAFADDVAPDFSEPGVAFVNQFCVACHSGADPMAELSLDAFPDSGSLVKQRKLWEGVVRVVTSGEMPPEGEPQPSVGQAEAFAELVKSIFDHADRSATPDPGRVTMRRLNRVEYRNTIRDLVGVDFDPTEDFPSDDIGHGFDNIGDVLSLSPVLMERYLAASEGIMNRAILASPPEVIRRNLASTYTEPASGESGGLVVNGFRPMRTGGDSPIAVGPIQTVYKWEDEGAYRFRTRVYKETVDGSPLRVTVLVSGEGLGDASADSELDGLLGTIPRPAKVLKTFEITASTADTAEVIEVDVPAIAGRDRMLVGIDRGGDGKPDATLWVEYLALDGPLDTRPASQRRLLAIDPSRPAVEQTPEVLGRFVRRAFRRPVQADEVDRLVSLVNDAISAGESWESAMQLAMQAVLCSPKFLFRMELDSAPTDPIPRMIDDFQLASRLSYFVWNSMPDDELLDLAERGELRNQLDAQVRRLLADDRADSLVQNFAMQWLQLRRIASIAPDASQFPSFSAELRSAMVRETELFFGSVIDEDRSVLDLIAADYTFVNPVLAKHYGIEGVAADGGGFVRVAVGDSKRGGLITQASLLTVTSNPTRTSPVKRGRWVLEQLFNAPPPPPPPNVPELEEQAGGASGGTLRERMEEHRRNPACANCHAKMDPIGFALENFDAIGAFRTHDGESEIDASGEFGDGTKIDGPNDLKALILERKEDFVRCLSEKMLTYAIGRGIEYYDRPVIERIVRNLPAEDYKFSALVTEIVKSDAFSQRRGL